MKSFPITGALMLATTVLLNAQEAPAAPAPAPAAPTAPAAPAMSPEQVKKNTSYGFGFQNGRQFAQQVGRFGIGASDIENAEFVRGFTAAMAGKEPEVSEKDIQAAMMALQSLMETREKELSAKNLEAGKAFLAENGKRKEVTTTKSGLQYEVLTKGGDKKYVPAKEGEDDNKQFLVNYRGTLIDGTEFDKSPEGQPVPMTLQVIPGFKEAITTMPVGAKWKLFIPADLAYGEQRGSADLGPNSTLIFELELVGIEDAPPPAAPGGFPTPQGQ
ncbi:MAG: FKBP-type peptidyl-prolyl cis-trans isomerase N-terminal domain-containing protein [Akkermansiaceae bacterium]